MHDLPLLVFQWWILISRMEWFSWFDNVSDVAIITVKNVDYRCIVYNISKSEAINLLKYSVFKNRGYI